MWDKTRKTWDQHDLNRVEAFLSGNPKSNSKKPSPKALGGSSPASKKRKLLPPPAVAPGSSGRPANGTSNVSAVAGFVGLKNNRQEDAVCWFNSLLQAFVLPELSDFLAECR